MEDKKDNSLIIIVIIIGLLVGAYFLYNNFNKKSDEEMEDADYGEYIPTPKKYEVNEYTKMNISDDQMSQIYLVNYQNYLKNDMNKAYSLVDKEYADIKCNNFDSFKTLVSNKKLATSKVKQYSVRNIDDYVYYIVIDSNNNTIVFKTNGVMQYTVYLDNETVVIDK